MGDLLAPIIVALIGILGGLYATKSSRATDKSNGAQQLIDQYQEKVKELELTIAAKEDEIIRQQILFKVSDDYAAALRAQVIAGGGVPLPWPELKR